jgi:hypothetical protein
MNLECRVEYQQSKKCMYNVTLRRVRLLIVVEKQVLILVNACLYSRLDYLACNAHLLCTVLNWLPWPAWLYRIFPHYLVQIQDFRKKLLNKKCVFCYVYNFFSGICLILGRI